MESLVSTLGAQLAIWIPRILGALLILVLGWIVAKILAVITKKLLAWIKLDARLGKGMTEAGEQPLSLEHVITQTVYYLVIFIAVLGALNALGMTAITAMFATMFATVFAYAPRVIYAIVLAVIAWIVARLLRAIVTRALHGVGADKRVTEPAGMQEAPISSAIGEAVYWLVWLLFLPAILSVLGLTGILLPIQAMLADLLSFLPKLLAAVVILIIGLFVARIVQRIIASALHALGVDTLSERVGLSQYLGKPGLSGLIGYIAYIIVLVPVIIAAVNALGLTYLAIPLSEMMAQVLLWIPRLFIAAVVLGLAYMIGRVLADVVTRLLTTAGFDGIVARASLGEIRETPSVSPSKLVGYLVLFVIMLFAAMAAAGLVGWASLVAILSAFMAFLARLLLGLVILIVGFYLAALATRLVMATGLKQRRALALLARIAILVFAVAMALDQIGLANDIVNMAFGLILAGAALAAALAFGLGGTDVAKFQLVRWYRDAEASLAESEAATPPATPTIPPPATLPPADLPPADLPDTDLPSPTL